MSDTIPANFKIDVIAEEQITLSWDAVTDATGYKVRYRKYLPFFDFEDDALIGQRAEGRGGFFAGRVWDGVKPWDDLEQSYDLNDWLKSTDVIEIGLGEKIFDVDGNPQELWVDRKIRLVAQGRNRSDAAWMEGVITAISGTNVTLDVTSVQGSGTFSDWAVVARYALILSPASWGDIGRFKWANDRDAGPLLPETVTLTNGPGATKAMIESNEGYSSTDDQWFALADKIREMNDYDEGNGREGHSDWYLPTRDELQIAGKHFAPYEWHNDNYIDDWYDRIYSRDGNIDDGGGFDLQSNWHSDPIQDVSGLVVTEQAELDIFKIGGAEAFEDGTYFTSSEASDIRAWEQSFSFGTQNPIFKEYIRRGRAFRREAI